MKFSAAPDNRNYSWRSVSENGQWELGIIPKIYGLAVGFSPVDARGPTIEYCCGDRPLFPMLLIEVIKTILADYPESVTEQELRRIFPAWKVRPIDKDDCWLKLQAMAFERIEARAKVS